MKLEELKGQMLAILFASGEPVEEERLAAGLGIDRETVYKVWLSVNDMLEQGMPFQVLHLEHTYQLVLREEFSPLVRQVLEQKKNTPLSQAALETLAVVAYNQPVTRAFVEQVRGVDSSGVISSLVEKRLIEEAGRLELPGRPLAYRTTANFLRCFGLESLEKLPPLPTEEEPQSQPEEQIALEELQQAQS